MDAIRDSLNRPIHDLRISVTDRCNFRCTYCMPEHETHQFTKPDNWLSFDEIYRTCKLFHKSGVKKFRITGGEPLLRPNIESLIKDLSKFENLEDLALTTNGSFLKEKSYELKKAGLHRLTVSLDSIDARIFKHMSGQKGQLHDVLEGIKAAEEAGFDSIKINVVIQKGVNDHAILDIVEHFRNTSHILRFIEYMDVGNCNHWNNKYVVPSREIKNKIAQTFPIEPLHPSYFGEVASRYRYKDGGGELGFISSITQPFCQSCTRARLACDGQLYTCLFAEKGFDLKTSLRSDATDQELLQMINDIWKKRDDRYSEIRFDQSKKTQSEKIEMYKIGG